MQQIPLDHLVSLNFLMRQVYKNSIADSLIFHCVSQIQTSTFITLNPHLPSETNSSPHLHLRSAPTICQSYHHRITFAISNSIVLSHAFSHHHILNTERMIQSSHFYRQRKITSDQHRLPIWKDLYSVQKWNNEIEIVLHNVNLMRIKNLHQSSLHDK